MIRMRTVNKAVEEIKAKDPETSISKNALHRWIKEGRIPAVRAGKKILVNLDALENYISGACMDRYEEGY